MRLPSVGRHSLHSEGFRAVLVRSTNHILIMKYAVFFLLVCVAMAAAAPQYITSWPGLVGGAGYIGGLSGLPNTLVAGPTVVNNPLGYGGRFIAPGYVGSALF